ncbi:uncharacterized protein [Periplaneta americana]|uniref:uncharacterized protein n=1 Tax=Periplaneta americana TaxID=6978 RepID=UPI0037E9C70E
MVTSSKGSARKLLASLVLLCALTLISTNDTLDSKAEGQKIQTALEARNTSNSERHSRSPPKPTPVNRATTLKQDAKTSKPQGSGGDLQGSGTETRRSAKSPLVLKLLQEQEATDIGNQLAFAAVTPAVHSSPQALPGPITYVSPEQEAVYYHQTPQENAGGTPEYAEPEEETPTHKTIEPTLPARYQYVYKVKDPDGNDFGHSEARVGDRTWGRYFVHLPDGRQKTVRYWADGTGFHAEVQYKGHAAHHSKGDH